MPHLDEGQIHAWLDGAVDGDEAARIEAHVAACSACAAEVAAARGLIAGASRILLALDDIPGGVIPAQRPEGASGGKPEIPVADPQVVEMGRFRDTKAAQRRPMAWLSRRSVGIAAGLMLAAGIGAIATREDGARPGESITIDFQTEGVTTTNPASTAVAPVATLPAVGLPAGAAGADANAVRSGAAAGRGELGRAEQADFASATGGASAAAVAAPSVLPAAEARLERAAVRVTPSPVMPAPPSAPPASRAVAERQASRADSSVEAQRAVAQAPALAQASAAKTTAGSTADTIRRRQIGDTPLRLESVVTTGASEPTAATRLGFTTAPGVPGPIGGACFALDVNPGADTLGIPLIPRKMQVQLAETPSMGESRLQLRGRTATANIQGAGVASDARRAPAGAGALGSAAATVVQPSDALSWTHFSADSVIARWPIASDVIVFRLGIFGDQVRGSAAGEASVAPPATVTGRKVACGG